MITIGERALLANFPQLQIPRGEEARLNIEVQGWRLPITVSFVDQGTEQGIEVRPENDGVRLEFRNWSNPIGSALKTPGHIATLTDGSRIEFLAVNYRIGDTNIFSLQLLHQGATE